MSYFWWNLKISIQSILKSNLSLYIYVYEIKTLKRDGKKKIQRFSA